MLNPFKKGCLLKNKVRATLQVLVIILKPQPFSLTISRGDTWGEAL